MQQIGCPEESDRGESSRNKGLIHTSKSLPNGSEQMLLTSSSQEQRTAAISDILWCLRTTQKGQPDKSFYGDSTWKGINNSLPGSDSDVDRDTRGVLTYTVNAKVVDITGKDPNTDTTWRERPVTFEFGTDAILIERLPPSIIVHSRRLVRLLTEALGYYPLRNNDDHFDATIYDIFPELMYAYQPLKRGLKLYLQKKPTDQQSDPRFEIGHCGDEVLTEPMMSNLQGHQTGISDLLNDDTNAQDTAALLRLLAGMFRTKVVPALTAIHAEMIPMVAYKDLWLLFRPGTLVYIKESALEDQSNDPDLNGNRWRNRNKYRNGYDPDNEYTACIIEQCFYQDKTSESEDVYRFFDCLQLSSWTIFWGDSKFQRIRHKTDIGKYDKLIPLGDLPVIPADLYDRSDDGRLRQNLQDRGAKYVKILQERAAHRLYTHKHSGYDGQVIIDPMAFRQFKSQDRYDPYLMIRPVPIADETDGHPWFANIGDVNPDKVHSRPHADDFYLLLPRRTEGFALGTKQWMVFEIEGISADAPNFSPNQLDSELVLVSDTDRDSLRTVLPRGEPSLGITPDFVAGKGEGKIFLLYGGPGTGKTLTVECVANETRRPLLRITAQDVGLETHVEFQLQTWFTLAAKWDAIILIDEADLFLEQRREGDLTRNSLSTVFLRTMEYYKGVLFLTTNRPGHIDDSFISRITCPIFYPALSADTKEKIIRRFVKRFEETDKIVIDDTATEYLCADLKDRCADLNGRELRNVLQNAVASAEVKLRRTSNLQGTRGQVVQVNMSHIKEAVNRQLGFKRYLSKLRGKDEDARARGKHSYLSQAPLSAEVAAMMQI